MEKEVLQCFSVNHIECRRQRVHLNSPGLEYDFKNIKAEWMSMGSKEEATTQ